MKRIAARIDANQTDVVLALRAIGDCSVQILSAVGCGVPDLMVGYRGVTVLMEIKDGDKSESRRRLTEDERKWHRGWRGGPVLVVESAEDAVGQVSGLAPEFSPQ